MFLDEMLQNLSLIQLANQNQATIGGHSRSLEIDLQGCFERELNGLVLFFTRGVCTSEASSTANAIPMMAIARMQTLRSFEASCFVLMGCLISVEVPS